MKKIQSNNHLTLGKKAEELACAFLEKQGLTLIEKNYRCFCGEIDLIMQDKQHVVFVEVRSRSRTEYGNALESVNYNKVRKIIHTATYFLQYKKWLYKVSSRFDVVAIHPIDGEMKLEWIRGAFEG